MKKITVALAAVALLGLHGVVAPAAGIYTVVAGNNTGGPGKGPLKYSERDAEAFADVFRRLGDVPGGNGLLLLGEDATAFRRALLDVNARIRSGNDGEASSLIVYYSGHADADSLQLGSTVLPYEELKAVVAGSPAGVRLLIIDACRSGGLTRVKGARPAEEFAIELDDRDSAAGMVILTSSAAGENSYESDRLRSSFFSHHLINALRGAADFNGDGRVTLSETYSYAYQQTLLSSGQTLSLQHPTFHYEMKGKGDIALTRIDGDATRSACLLLPEPGSYLLLEEREKGPVAAELCIREQGGRIVLPPGHYLVQKRDPDRYREYSVRLQSGGEADLSRTPFRTVAYARLVRKGGGQRRAVHGLLLMGGAQGGVLPGEGFAPQVVAGYTLDLPWLSLGLRARHLRTRTTAQDGILVGSHSQYGIGLSAQRFVDLVWLSVSLGLVLEGVYHTQTFETPGYAPDRSAWGLGFGGLLAAEKEIVPAVVVHLEGGPITQVLPRGVTQEGVLAGEETGTPLTWWAACGLGWRF